MADKWYLFDAKGDIREAVGNLDPDKLLLIVTDMKGNPTGEYINLTHMKSWEIVKDSKTH